jgi:hypothetical protein
MIDTSEIAKFREGIFSLLNWAWPHKSEVDPDTAKLAEFLAAKLRIWDSQK